MITIHHSKLKYVSKGSELNAEYLFLLNIKYLNCEFDSIPNSFEVEGKKYVIQYRKCSLDTHHRFPKLGYYFRPNRVIKNIIITSDSSPIFPTSAENCIIAVT